MSDYMVAMLTHGTITEFIPGTFDLEEARGFVADPPSAWAPRPQDELRVYELREVESGE